ncbi:MAG: octaprenyl-diphosphate synthase, partial [Armatimonadetes bacterium]|nr:octaprenyl-diphosphate synthase [Armatimonadota bacterium]
MKQAALLSGPADLIRGELEQVEAILEEACLSEVELLQEAARNIVTAGGKRLRPQLALLSAAAAGARPGRAVAVAAACELIHTATLVHDDIVDESDSRRGRMSSRYFYGNSASVLMGDYLVVRAFRLVSCEPDRRHWTFMADTIARMCEGEVLQLCERGNTEPGVEVYERIIECKTALLMSLCCRLGAFLG